MLVSNLFSAALLGAIIPSVVAQIPERPQIVPAPYNAGRSLPESAPRESGRYCYVVPGNGTDDAGQILKAMKKCNNGGTVVLDKTYNIASPLDLTWLKQIDIVVTGEIYFKDDPYYWADNSFKFAFQNMSVFWKFGGEDINIYGDLSNDKSVIDGQGQSYWEENLTNKTVSDELDRRTI